MALSLSCWGSGWKLQPKIVSSVHLLKHFAAFSVLLKADISQRRNSSIRVPSGSEPGVQSIKTVLNQNRHPLQSNLVNYLGDIFKAKPLLTFGFANLDKSQYGQIEWNANVEPIDSGNF